MKSKTHIVSHDKLELVFKTGYDGTKMMLHSREQPDARATFAMELLRVHAGITAQTDGEDRVGRAKIRRDTPEEAVGYACAVAYAAFAEFSKRGWLVPVPSWEEIEEKAKPEN